MSLLPIALTEQVAEKNPWCVNALVEVTVAIVVRLVAQVDG
jgi:hypothetical protein